MAKDRLRMSGESPKAKAAAMDLDPKSHRATIRKLIADDFFDSPVSSKEVARRVSEKSGKRLKTIHVQTNLKTFLQADILHAVKLDGTKGNFWVLTSVSRSTALKLIGKSRKVIQLREELFAPGLKNKLETICSQELAELQGVFGNHGNCTAFLLRKIFEKMLIITFAKNSKEHLLEDPARPGGWKGLQEMIETAAREKHGGIPFLTGKTAKETKGVKFLGDTAAHNPKVGVAMETIVPQMPYIITAYEELAALL
jgi:hypothetical protein